MRQALSPATPLFRRGVSRPQGIDILDQLEGLLTAGLPLDRALRILDTAVDSAAASALVRTLLLDIEKGATLADALAAHPAVFDTIETNMVRAGEAGGILAEVIRRIVDHSRARREFRRFLITTSIYPMILLAFGIVAVGGILLFVLPSFAEAYPDLSRANLPARLLMALSEFLQSRGWHLLAAVGVVIAGLAGLWRQPRLRAWAQSRLLELPVFGPLVVRAELARVLHTLGVLIGAGVPILVALRLARSLTAFPRIDAGLVDAERSLREGRGLARPFLAERLFPRLVGQMATVGEESGALDRMLLRVAQRFESDVRNRLKTLLALLEPLLILGIGLVIGAIVISLIAAIFSLNEMPL